MTDVNLSVLLEDIVPVSKQQDLSITGLTLDSRQVTSGDLFLALRGGQVHGVEYVAQAEKNGAVAAVVECEAAEQSSVLSKVMIPVFFCNQLSRNVGKIADRFFTDPSRALHITAITGTNGKTSSSYFLAQSLQYFQLPCVVIGTTGYGLLDHMQQASHTTPDAIRLRKLLKEFQQQGLHHVAMEVSSHALQQFRVENLQFQIAVFTNLSRDHLDYHGSMDEYGRTKARLFAWPELAFAVINYDDEFGRMLSRSCDCRQVVYSLDPDVQQQGFEEYVYAEILRSHSRGFHIKIHSHLDSAETQIHLLGKFNLSNILAVCSALMCMGYPLQEIAKALAHCRAVPGRMEAFGGEEPLPLVIVDYAHTPDALEKSLQALQSHITEGGDLWVVFGCGGDRDSGKRPLMGKIAEQWAQKVVVTDDNPRHEDHKHIVRQILQGMKTPDKVTVNHDREAAIRQTIQSACDKDIVLVAGKGHEEYQQVGDERRPFSDVLVVNRTLREMAA